MTPPSGSRGLGREDRRGPRQLQQGLRAGRAVRGRLELIRAGRTARRPTFDAAEMVERELHFGPATTMSRHALLLDHEMSQEGVKSRSSDSSARSIRPVQPDVTAKETHTSHKLSGYSCVLLDNLPSEWEICDAF